VYKIAHLWIETGPKPTAKIRKPPVGQRLMADC
jgi:hypothetical protein